MTDDEFRAFRSMVNERSGIYFGEDTRHVVQRRLRERVQALGLASYQQYSRHVRSPFSSEAELQEVYDLLVTKETYFFREEYQLRAFREELLPVLASEGAVVRRLACWSAGCSTGEEAYSIAISLMESGLFGDWRLHVYGTDLIRRNLAAAREGVYPESAFRATPQNLRRKYFVEGPLGIQIIDKAKHICQFGLMNLMNMSMAPRYAQLDVIFCKNVLIYFDPESRQRVLDGLWERLRPGGYLLLGHSESLLNESTKFELVHLRGDVAYRRPLHTPPHSRRRRTSA